MTLILISLIITAITGGYLQTIVTSKNNTEERLQFIVRFNINEFTGQGAEHRIREGDQIRSEIIIDFPNVTQINYKIKWTDDQPFFPDSWYLGVDDYPNTANPVFDPGVNIEGESNSNGEGSLEIQCLEISPSPPEEIFIEAKSLEEAVKNINSTYMNLNATGSWFFIYENQGDGPNLDLFSTVQYDVVAFSYELSEIKLLEKSPKS
jgi:hypothetical protein